MQVDTTSVKVCEVFNFSYDLYGQFCIVSLYLIRRCRTGYQERTVGILATGNCRIDVVPCTSVVVFYVSAVVFYVSVVVFCVSVVSFIYDSI